MYKYFGWCISMCSIASFHCDFRHCCLTLLMLCCWDLNEAGDDGFAFCIPNEHSMCTMQNWHSLNEHGDYTRFALLSPYHQIRLDCRIPKYWIQVQREREHSEYEIANAGKTQYLENNGLWIFVWLQTSRHSQRYLSCAKFVRASDSLSAFYHR